MATLSKKISNPWQGFLSFTLEKQFEKTVVKDKKHFGPLVLQRPYYQESNRPTILVIHPPGGVVSGDQLTTEITLKPNAEAFISTPAATKFYRSIGDKSFQTQTLHLHKNTQLEWLPQETLFFDQVSVDNHLHFNLHDADCQLICWDIVGLGRPAMSEQFSRGEFRQKVELSLQGLPLFIDQFYFNNNTELLASPFGLNHATLFANMLFYHPDLSRLQEVKDLILQEDWCKKVAVTLVDKVLLVRTLDSDMEDLKARLIRCWQLARPLVIGVEPVRPRIWNT